MTTEFKQDNPGCGDDDCCGCTEPPTCTLSGAVSGSNIVLSWSVSGVAITSAVITNEEGDSYTLTVPPNSGTLSVPKSDCRQWVLTVVNDCGSSTCNFNESNCTVLYLRTVACSTCTDIDYPSSLRAPRQAKISISGVTVGSNTSAPNFYSCSTTGLGVGHQFWSETQTPPGAFLSNANCERNAMAANASFFNSDFTLDPCTEVWQYNCRYICSSDFYGFGIGPPWPNIDYFEWNVLGLSYQPGIGAGDWNVSADLYSWVAFYNRPTAGTICTSVGTLFGGPPVNNNTQRILVAPSDPAILYRWLSFRRKTISFNMSAGTKKGYYYDPALCDAECNYDVDLARCLPSGLVASVPSTSFSQTCPNEKALNVNAATGSVTIL